MVPLPSSSDMGVVCVGWKAAGATSAVAMTVYRAVLISVCHMLGTAASDSPPATGVHAMMKTAAAIAQHAPADAPTVLVSLCAGPSGPVSHFTQASRTASAIPGANQVNRRGSVPPSQNWRPG